MESSAKRRLDSIYRHLLLSHDSSDVLCPVLTNGGGLVKEAEPVIIGGMVLDIYAVPSIPANPRTSTPGKVNYILGGVARNVAECMSKLGTLPLMISAVGLDLAGNLLLENWKTAGLPIEGIRKHQEIQTAVVCNVIDVNGELAAGVASVEAIEEFLTPEWIKQFKGNIHSSPALMVDANLSPLALEMSCKLAAESNIPVWFEPVSVAKSRRIASISKYITFASPNEDELISMANALSGENLFSPIERHDNSSIMCSEESLFDMLKLPIWILLEKGIKIVIVTIGSNGVFLCSKGGPSFIKTGLEGTKTNNSLRELFRNVTRTCLSNRFNFALDCEKSSHLFAFHFPALPTSVVRLTGAGDCLVGGTLASICAGLDIMQSMAVGIAAAKAAVGAETNVPVQFDFAKIADDAKWVYSASRVVFHQSML